MCRELTVRERMWDRFRLKETFWWAVNCGLPRALFPNIYIQRSK